MSILTGVMVGAGVLKGVGGIFGSSKAKKRAEAEYKYQRERLTQEYNFNLGILKDNLINNALANYSTIAGIMYGVTEEFVKGKNDALMSTRSYFTGGTSYNSNRQDALNNLTLDYTNAISEYMNMRDYNEQNLIKQYNIDVTNLTNRYNYQNYQLGSSLYSARQQASNNMIGGLLDSALMIFGGLQAGGSTEGFGIFGKNSGGDFIGIPESDWLG